MKRILFLTVVALAFVGCSSEYNKDAVTISLDKSSLSLNCKEKGYITILGANASDCQISSSEDFTTELYVSDNKIEVYGNHIGTSTILVKYNNQLLECQVSVTPLYSFIGNPIVELGISLNDLKSKVSGTIETETASQIEYKENANSIYDTYYFENGKLILIASQININTFILDITNSLRERYDYVSSSSNAYWFSYPNTITVRMNERSGNEGYLILYAKDVSIMNKYYQV